MKSQAGVYISVGKALVRAGVNCSPSYLQAPENCPVGIKCIHDIYEADGAPEIIADYRKIQKPLFGVLSSPSVQTASGLAQNPNYHPSPVVAAQVRQCSRKWTRTCKYGN